MMRVEQHPITSREEWLARRRTLLTASDVAAVAGVDNYRTPLEVFAEKSGLAGPQPDTPLMRRGRWLESAAREALAELQPTWEIQNPRTFFAAPQLGLGATPDAFAVAPDRPGIGNLQLKVVAKPTFEREWAEGAPLKYQLQSLTEAMLADCAWNALVALVISTYDAELHIVEVPRHEGAEARIRVIAEEFWEGVRAGRMPAADYARDFEMIRALHPKGGAGTLDLSGNNRIGQLAEEYLRWQGRRKAAEGALDVVGAEICDLLGNHDVGEHPDFRISWKLQHTKEYTVAARDRRILRITRRSSKAENEDAI